MIVRIGNMRTIPSKEKINPVNSGACNMECIISGLFWNNSVVKQLLCNFNNCLINREQGNIYQQAQSPSCKNLITPTCFI